MTFELIKMPREWTLVSITVKLASMEVKVLSQQNDANNSYNFRILRKIYAFLFWCLPLSLAPDTFLCCFMPSPTFCQVHPELVPQKRHTQKPLCQGHFKEQGPLWIMRTLLQLIFIKSGQTKWNSFQYLTNSRNSLSYKLCLLQYIELLPKKEKIRIESMLSQLGYRVSKCF